MYYRSRHLYSVYLLKSNRNQMLTQIVIWKQSIFTLISMHSIYWAGAIFFDVRTLGNDYYTNCHCATVVRNSVYYSRLHYNAWERRTLPQTNIDLSSITCDLWMSTVYRRGCLYSKFVSLRTRQLDRRDLM